MCWAASVAQGALGIASTVMQQRAAEAQATEGGKAAAATATNAITSMNHEFTNYESERMDAFDQAVSQIQQVRSKAMVSQAAVQAAINEDMSGGGRTADLLARSVQAVGSKNIAAIKDNYISKSNEIDLNKETTLNNAKSYVSGIKAPKAPSRWGAVLTATGQAVSAYTSATNARADAVSKGADFDFYRGAVAKGTATNKIQDMFNGYEYYPKGKKVTTGG